MLERKDIWHESSSVICFSRALNLETLPGSAADGMSWKFYEHWQAVEEEGDADNVGVISHIRISLNWEAGVHGGSWFSSTVQLATTLTVVGSLENGFGGTAVLWFARMFCTNSISSWSWMTTSCEVCRSNLSVSGSRWSWATLSCTACSFSTCLWYANGNFCSQGVVCLVEDSQ